MQRVADQLCELDGEFCTQWMLAGGAEVLLNFTETVVPLQQTCIPLIDTAVALLQHVVTMLRHAVVLPAKWGPVINSDDYQELRQICVSCSAVHRLVKMLPMITHSDLNKGNTCTKHHCQVSQPC